MAIKFIELDDDVIFKLNVNLASNTGIFIPFFFSVSCVLQFQFQFSNYL